MSLFQKIFWTLVLMNGGLVAAQDSTTYTIEYGDVLDVIAAAYDVSVDCLAEASDITDPNQVRPGDTLVISAACPPYEGLAFVPNPRDETEGQGGGSVSLSGGDVSYTVRRGDVLDLIAAAFDVSVTCIADESGIADPNRINVGDELTISATCPPYDGEAFVPNPRGGDETEADSGDNDQGGGSTVAAGGDNTYLVQTGDVLDLIAASFDVSIQCTAEASGLDSPHEIFTGDVIVIDLTCPRYDGDAFVPNPRGGAQPASTEESDETESSG
jgi:LysM repeat protein